jgi:hypothetical protein
LIDSVTFDWILLNPVEDENTVALTTEEIVGYWESQVTFSTDEYGNQTGYTSYISLQSDGTIETASSPMMGEGSKQWSGTYTISGNVVTADLVADVFEMGVGYTGEQVYQTIKLEIHPENGTLYIKWLAGDFADTLRANGVDGLTYY